MAFVCDGALSGELRVHEPLVRLGSRPSLDQWRQDVASGEIVEVFACGTAAVVTPIGVLKGKGFFDEQPIGTLALELRKELTDIQYGRLPDKHGWLLRLDA